MENKDVLRWYNNVRRGSVVNSEIMLRALNLFCEQNKITPMQLLNMDLKSIEDLLSDHVTKMEKEGKAPGYIINVLKAVKSWLSFNGIQLKRRIKVSNSTSTPTIENERVPTHEELRTILLHADERTKVAISLMAFSGLRPMSLGNALATDGLRIGDLPDLRIENGKVTFSKIPAMVV